MKKILSIILALCIVASFASCGKKAGEEMTDDKNVVETNKPEENADKEIAEDKQEDKKEDKNEKPAETQKPQEEKPQSKPQEEKPQETPAPAATTLGKTLLADFKSKANLGVQEIADALLSNPAIKFAGGAMPVEPGLLSGFDNAEITGFKSGAMFAPMIGSIAFVGYVFELENAADAPAFIANLEKNANLRWNICVTADEMVTGSAGNKVFFVMCPTTMEE